MALLRVVMRWVVGAEILGFFAARRFDWFSTSSWSGSASHGSFMSVVDSGRLLIGLLSGNFAPCDLFGVQMSDLSIRAML